MQNKLHTPSQEGLREENIGLICLISPISLIVLSSKENKQHKLPIPSSEGLKEHKN